MSTAVIFSRNDLKLPKVTIDGMEITAGLIDLPVPMQASDFLEENPRYVLVKKKAFSCNFRDKAIIVSAAYDTNFMYSPFGSEFVGDIICIGKKVKLLSEGDRVIPNANFSASEKFGSGLPTNFASMEYEFFDERKLLKIKPHMPDNIAASFTIGAQTSYSIIEKLGIKKSTKANILLWSVSSNTSLFLLEALKKFSRVNIFGITTKKAMCGLLQKSGLKDIWLYDSLSEQKNSSFLNYFDYIFDPFCDLHFTTSLKYLKSGGKYVTCGIFNQYNKPTQIGIYEQLFPTIILQNLNIMGNCLGTTKNIQQALDDYYNDKLAITIDSAYSISEIDSFLERTFVSSERLGKVVCNF